jgi:hypothetical protein
MHSNSYSNSNSNGNADSDSNRYTDGDPKRNAVPSANSRA